jgi:Holliday junction resolvase RusA-like endonuclease
MKRVPTVTHQDKAVRVVRGKPQFYEPPALADARAKLMAHLAQHRPEKPLTGALRLTVSWYFWTDDPAREGMYRTTKPDTDNLQKLLKDCMTALAFWKDDAQVVSDQCIKLWAHKLPGIYVAIDQLE